MPNKFYLGTEKINFNQLSDKEIQRLINNLEPAIHGAIYADVSLAQSLRAGGYRKIIKSLKLEYDVPTEAIEL